MRTPRPSNGSNPNRTVVLVIHGLMASQATWTPMINTLRGDPVVRKHYQFWFYSYASGYPYLYSAAILRTELNRVDARFPNMKPMVVIGHSMGGCISRLLLTDSGNDVWMKIFGRPPAEVPLTAKTREYFRQELFFRHRPEVGRAIFVAALLKGSNLATGLFGKIAAMTLSACSRVLGMALGYLKFRETRTGTAGALLPASLSDTLMTS